LDAMAAGPSSSSHPSSSNANDAVDEVLHAADSAMSALPVPDSFKCPIACEIIRDPVTTCDGHVYERTAIQEWIKRGRAGRIISPKTGLILPDIRLTPNLPLKRAIDEYMSLRPALLQSAAATLEQELLAKSRSGANPQDDNMWCRKTLLNAAMRGDVVGCIDLIQKGFAFLNEKDDSGCTALHHAVKSGLVPVVFALLSAPRFTEHHAVGALDSSDWTAVELAVAAGQLAMAVAMKAYMDTASNARASSQHVSERKGTGKGKSRVRAGARGKYKGYLDHVNETNNHDNDSGWAASKGKGKSKGRSKGKSGMMLGGMPGHDSCHDAWRMPSMMGGQPGMPGMPMGGMISMSPMAGKGMLGARDSWICVAVPVMGSGSAPVRL